MRYLAHILDELDDQGRLITIKHALSRSYEPTKAILDAEAKDSAVLFKVKDTVLESVSNVMGTRRDLYRALGVNSDEEAYMKLLGVSTINGSGNFVEEGFSDHFEILDCSVEDLPAIKFYEKDGGRYITSSILIAKTPEIDSFNASVHRLMLVPGRGFAIRLVPRHLYKIYRKNLEEGKETPVAIMIGVDPLLLLASALSPPYGVFELSIYSSIVGERARVVRTPKYGLPVHASASIVLEGRITKELVNEGPFVDLLNLYDRERKQPLIKIDAIYVNKVRPYFHVILPGGKEHKILMGFPREAMIWDAVRKAVPKVRKVRLTEAGGGWLHAVISIEKGNDGDGKSAIMAAFGAHPSVKHVVVVDSDIDPDNMHEVEWAIATRFQAHRGLIVIHHARGSTLDPSAEDGITSKVGIDATCPINDRDKYVKPRLP